MVRSSPCFFLSRAKQKSILLTNLIFAQTMRFLAPQSRALSKRTPTLAKSCPVLTSNQDCLLRRTRRVASMCLQL
ncbi:hypothetical protein CPB83DRAFT_864562 [Crepidotus variabilis]|uniref:Uncharacterized protein n=1 Tax=Crepidotus variabilis TaxID=179855 RepID=A0A9P6JII6_9AGAR|nr:hypothetical protein CPB83DRAFT_864562 [Crepidotus variabilis]